MSNEPNERVFVPWGDLELAPQPRYVGHLLVVDWPDPKPEHVILTPEMLSLLFEWAYGFPLCEDHGLESFFGVTTGRFEEMIAEGNRRADPALSS